MLIVERGLAPSRERAQALLLAGQVRVNGERMEKPGSRVATDARIELIGEGLRYASRGGLKLEGALEDFGVTPREKDLPRCGQLDRRIHRLPAATRRAKSLCRGRDHRSARLETAEGLARDHDREKCALPAPGGYRRVGGAS